MLCTFYEANASHEVRVKQTTDLFEKAREEAELEIDDINHSMNDILVQSSASFWIHLVFDAFFTGCRQSVNPLPTSTLYGLSCLGHNDC